MSEDQIQADNALLTEDDLSKLGLGDHPFVEHAEDIYLYSDSRLEMTSNIIMEYLTNPATTIVLMGEDGVGKTTFLRKVLRLGYQQYQFCTIRVNNETDFEFIEDKIKQRWVLLDTNEHSSVSDLSIENYVICYLREHTHAVLIIDDAHCLDSSTLDWLFTLKHRIGLACPLGLGFILAGENTFKLSITELEDSNPACTQVYQINVRPFSREQTGHYIEHRLHTAGFKDEVLLDDAKVTEIYKATLGNVRKIHESAIAALLDQSRDDSLGDMLNPNITIRKPKPKVPVFLISILAIIGISLYANSRINSDSADEVIIPLEKPRSSEPTLSPISLDPNIPSSMQTPSLPLPNAPTAPTNTFDIKFIKVPQITLPKKSEDEVSLLSESIEVLDENQLEDLTEKSSEKAQSAEIIESKTIETVAKPIAVIGTPQAVSHSASTTKGESWLKQLDSESYTLQVVTTTDSKPLESLIKKEKLKDNYAYFDKQVKGTTFYVLVIGNYKTRDDALAAVDQLPANLRKNKPWPVALKNIQIFLN